MSKTLVNNLEDIVVEALDAWLLTQPHLTRLDGFPVSFVSLALCAACIPLSSIK